MVVRHIFVEKESPFAGGDYQRIVDDFEVVCRNGEFFPLNIVFFRVENFVVLVAGAYQVVFFPHADFVVAHVAAVVVVQMSVFERRAYAFERFSVVGGNYNFVAASGSRYAFFRCLHANGAALFIACENVAELSEGFGVVFAVQNLSIPDCYPALTLVVDVNFIWKFCFYFVLFPRFSSVVADNRKRSVPEETFLHTHNQNGVGVEKQYFI